MAGGSDARGDWRAVYRDIVGDLTASLKAAGGVMGGWTGNYEHHFMVAWNRKEFLPLVIFPKLGRNGVWTLGVSKYEAFRECFPQGRCVALFLTDRTRGHLMDEEQLDLGQPDWPKNRAQSQYQLLERHLRGSRAFKTSAECAAKLAEVASHGRREG